MARGKVTVKYDKTTKLYYLVDNPRKTFKKKYGNKREVWKGDAYRTKYGLMKDGLKLNNSRSIVSNALSNAMKYRSNRSIANNDEHDVEHDGEHDGETASSGENSSISSVNQPTRKKFIYKLNGEVLKECLLEEHVCRKDGCHIKTNYPIEYCKRHLMTEMGLCIKPSTLKGNAGNGLFACNGKEVKDHWKLNEVVFRKNQMICEYNGKLIDKNEMDDIHKYYGPYVLELNNGTNIDTACMRGVGSFINHKSLSAANTRFTENEIYAMMHGYVTANKDIRNGSELFVSYGRSFGPMEKMGITSETVDVEN